MYNAEDIHGFFLDKKKDTLFVDNSTEREQELLSYIEELENKIEKLESKKNYEDIVRKFLKKTKEICSWVENSCLCILLLMISCLLTHNGVWMLI